MSDNYNNGYNQNNQYNPNNQYNQYNQNNQYNQYNPNNQYSQNNQFNSYNVPFMQVKTDRSFGMYLLLSIVTCGIYGIVFWTKLVDDLNMIANPRDNKPTMHFCLMYFLLGPITCQIYTLIWYHGFSQRLGDEARSRGITTDFGSSTFWLWGILGSFIIVGPFIYMYKAIETMNIIAMSYNQNGR